jgi:peptidoglycan/LPS O-acetylase OafA/YrhL
MSTKKEIDSLTGLRFFAAISVAFAHGSSQILNFQQGSAVLTHWLSTFAGFGMTLFFVLSGFVIHYNYCKLISSHGISGCLEFIWARFSRLYPLFFIIVVVDLIINSQFSVKILISFIDGIESLKALPWFLLFVQSWFYQVINSNALIYQFGQSTPLTWSISTEWFFYLTFIFLAYPFEILTRQSPLKNVVILFGWILIFWLIATYTFDQKNIINDWAKQKFGVIASTEHGYRDSFVRWLLYFSPYLRMGEFITGCLTSSFFLSLREKPVTAFEARCGKLLMWVVLGSIPFLLFLMYTPMPIWHGIRKVSHNIGLAPSIAMLILGAARYKNNISRFFSWHPIVYMGEASYSIYLIHMLVFHWAAASVPQNILPVTSTGVIFGIIRFFVVLAMIITISIGLYEYIEVPARKKLRNMWVPGAKFQGKVLGILGLPLTAALVFLLFFGSLGVSQGEISQIMVTSATYGGNCGAAEGNATAHVQSRCSRSTVCDYIIHVANLGDPASNCGKNFRIKYTCANGIIKPEILIPGEAGLGSHIILNCTP